MKILDPTSQRLSSEELDIERALRPLSFEFCWSGCCVRKLQVFVKAANLRGEALDIPFSGLQVL